MYLRWGTDDSARGSCRSVCIFTFEVTDSWTRQCRARSVASAVASQYYCKPASIACLTSSSGPSTPHTNYDLTQRLYSHDRSYAGAIESFSTDSVASSSIKAQQPCLALLPGLLWL